MNLKMVLAAVSVLAMAGASASTEPPQTGGGPNPASVKKPVVTDEEAARNYFTDLALVTQDGKPVRFYTDVLKDKVVLISFIFTECANACPLITQKLTLVRDQLEGQLGDPIQFVSISLDPNRDTPAALKKFARRHNADHDGWVFLTGDSENVERIVKKLGQYSEDLQSHSTMILAGNVKYAHWTKIAPNAPSMAIAEKLRMLVRDGDGDGY